MPTHLGHETLSMTLGTYAQVMPESVRKMVEPDERQHFTEPSDLQEAKRPFLMTVAISVGSSFRADCLPTFYPGCVAATPQTNYL